MPNHVHLLFSISAQEHPENFLRNWKGLTSRTINRALNRSGSLWQKDYFDRLIRNSEHFWNCARYIRNNPQKARLARNEYLLFESDFVREGLDDWEGRLPSRPPKKKTATWQSPLPVKTNPVGSAAAAPSQ
jgi:hypothetical protein